jgi:hypothetical protein
MSFTPPSRRRPAAGSAFRSLRCRCVPLFALLWSLTGWGGRLSPAEPFPPHTILDGLQHAGTRFESPAGAAALGQSLAPAGDVNGDGWPDLLLGAAGSGDAPGRAWIVLGGVRRPERLVLRGVEGQIVELSSGSSGADRFGALIAPAGDVDGDGLDDILIGAPGALDAPLSRGGVYLVFGSRRLLPASDLRTLAGRAILFHSGREDASLGLSAGGIGDIDGDGFPDLAFGLPAVTAKGGAGAGKAFIIFGGPHLRSGPELIDLEGLDGRLGLEIDGPVAGGELGAAIASLGDADQDGIDDFAVAAPAAGGRGSVHVIFGRAGPFPPLELSSGDPSRSVELRGEPALGRLGQALSGGLDATGDGAPDILLGAPESSRGEISPVGLAILVAGGPALRARPLLTVPESGNFLFHGTRGDQAGAAVALVPDLSGDGIAEILIGAPGTALDLGAAYLMYGGQLLEPMTFLGNLGPPFGARFVQNARAGRLGQAVAGLGDRSGDLRGELVIGTPGFAGAHAQGAVYEVFARAESSAPRNLACSKLTFDRVLLTWMAPQVHRYLTVYRDGVPIAGPLPGDLLRFVDTGASGGRQHEYFVEANGDPGLRSNRCRIELRPLPVRDLSCRQLPGTTEVELHWRNGDVYEALQVLANGLPQRPRGEDDDLLPGSATSAVLVLEPGAYRIEVFEPFHAAESFRPHCDIVVVRPSLAPVEDFRCSSAGRGVRLEWSAAPLYDAYELRRNGLFLARLQNAGPYLDDCAPAGLLTYEIRGIQAELHRGPPARCAIELSPEGALRIEGRVVFDDSCGTPLGRGRIVVHDAGRRQVGCTQLDGAGGFQVPVSEPGAYSLTFEVEVPALSVDGVRTAGAGQRLLSTAANVQPGRFETLRVALPVVAAATSRSDLRLWQELAARLSGRSLLYPALVPGGVARGSLALERRREQIHRHLAEQLGGAPCESDLVAYGFAGLAARLHLHTMPLRSVRKLVLIGTPHLGTPRAHAELRGQLATRLGSGSFEQPEEAEYSGADEQTAAFLEQFNRRITNTRGAEVHLVAGTGGRRELDPALGCISHDSRVCRESASGLGGAFVHQVDEDHATLGRGARSLRVLIEEVKLGALSEGSRPLVRGLAPAAAGGGGGGGILGGSGYPIGTVYTGVLQSGDQGLFALLSDTSGSIIIILSTKQPGSLQFSVVDPAGSSINPANAGGFGVEYLSLSDGEGQLLQTYKFASGQSGVYLAHLENPAAGGVAVEYSLEIYLESAITMEAELDPPEVEPSGSSTVRATLREDGLAIPGLTVSARVERPDGSIDLLSLADDGEGADLIAGDGTYSAAIPPSPRPGLHIVEVSARDGPGARLQRTATLQLLVRSAAARFTGVWRSGTADHDSDSVLDELWVEGAVECDVPGTFLVIGRLSDLAGNEVARSGTVFSLPRPQQAAFRLRFDGREIRAAGRDGPYLLEEVELLDAGVGFVRADHLVDAHTTAFHSWRDFDPGSASRSFVRGDANADDRVDMTDAVAVLYFLFNGWSGFPCREAADINEDGAIDISDAIHLLGYLFLGRPAPPFPYPDCGAVTPPVLGCESHPPCSR